MIYNTDLTPILKVEGQELTFKYSTGLRGVGSDFGVCIIIVIHTPVVVYVDE